MIADDLLKIDYQSLPISDYSRNYILRLLPNLRYYLRIYEHCIAQTVATLKQKPDGLTIVDYGGGHGFLSCLLKRHGFGRVIYIDINPLAVETVAAVKQRLGYGPDNILQGDAATLRHWCRQNSIAPDALLGMDVIEHVYRLDTFFDELFATSTMPMLFTTGSNPDNPIVTRRLRKVMNADEYGKPGKTGFLHQRRQYLADQFPHLSPEELDYWAMHTRGLAYGDIAAAVNSNTPVENRDPYNTCDPASGSWTERILPFAEYRKLIAPHAAHLTVTNGFYNIYRSPQKAIPSRMLNLFLQTCPGMRCLAPFIVLQITPRHNSRS